MRIEPGDKNKGTYSETEGDVICGEFCGSNSKINYHSCHVSGIFIIIAHKCFTSRISLCITLQSLSDLHLLLYSLSFSLPPNQHNIVAHRPVAKR
jgi:hypothetical protein